MSRKKLVRTKGLGKMSGIHRFVRTSGLGADEVRRSLVQAHAPRRAVLITPVLSAAFVSASPEVSVQFWVTLSPGSDGGVRFSG
jgi:hypothetical protein